MNSAPHLLSEDRPEFERVLDEALCAEDTKIALSSGASHLNSEQLRTLALGAAAAIAACADTEYQHYREMREQVRARAAAPVGRGPSGGGDAASGGLAGAMGEISTETAGAGFVAVVAVLAPILAGIAAVIFLCVGYALEVIEPEPSMAPPLRTVGWAFAAMAGAGIAIGMAAVLLTALRNPAAESPSARLESSPEVASAREAWRKALLDQGVRPFLHNVLLRSVPGPGAEHPEHAGDTHRPRARDTGHTPSRTPRRGYSRPGFTSPNPGNREPDPGNPPDPGNREPQRGGPDYSSPDYSSPDYSSPRWSSPDFDTGSDQTDAEPA